MGGVVYRRIFSDFELESMKIRVYFKWKEGFGDNLDFVVWIWGL